MSKTLPDGYKILTLINETYFMPYAEILSPCLCQQTEAVEFNGSVVGQSCSTL